MADEERVCVCVCVCDTEKTMEETEREIRTNRGGD